MSKGCFIAILLSLLSSLISLNVLADVPCSSGLHSDVFRVFGEGTYCLLSKPWLTLTQYLGSRFGAFHVVDKL